MIRSVELDAPGTLIDLVRSTATDSAPCRAFYTAEGTAQIEQKVQSASAQLADVLSQIHRLAPHARVYVIGSPDLLPSSENSSCALELGITSGDAAFLGTHTPSLGHDACSDQSTRWIESLVPVGAAPLHPNARGEQAMAEATERVVGAVK